MSEPTPREPENLYRPGYFPALRARLAGVFRYLRLLVLDPGVALPQAARWLGQSLRADARFFAAILAFFTRGIAGGVRNPRTRRWVLGAFVLLGFALTFSWQRCGLTGCPDVRRLRGLQPGGNALVYDAGGNVIADLSPARWAVVDLKRLPEYVPAAFVAVEDQNFYRHKGVHWPRFIAQTVRNLIPGQRGAGASTITMQLARNVFPDRLPASERTVRRKLLEIRVAQEIERHYTKDEILQLYLNNIYFGEGVYGIASGARVYFGKNPSDLRLSEAAMLAGLPKAPTNYNPRRNLQRSIQRRNLVLSLMAAQGRVTADDAAEAKEAPVRLARWNPEERRRSRAPYFTEQVRRTLEAELGDALYQGGLKIHTTLDPRVQASAETQLEAQLRAVENGAFGRFSGPRRSAYRDSTETPYLQGGAVFMDAETGDVLALVGGRSWQESRFDRINQGLRQPGSAFKPFVYATAIAEGTAPTDTVRDDTLRRELPGGEVWVPRNFDGRYRGVVTVRTALRQSINTVAITLAERAGLEDVETTARRAGISADMPPLPSIAIGATAVRPMELVTAYTPFATLGYRVQPRYVTRVEDRDGNVIWRQRVRRRRVMDPGVAFVVTSLMRGVVDRGTGTAARAALGDGIPAAGKTGTTNGATDAWFVGFTPQRVGAVWIGFDRPRTITADGSGGRLAAPVWGRIMRVAMRGQERETWRAPGGVVQRQVTVSRDQVVAPGCRARGDTYTEYFLRRHVPAAICPRGTRRDDRGWWERTRDDVGTRVREWGREAWDDLRGRVRRVVGRDDPVDPDKGTESTRRERRPATAPVTEVEVDTVAVEPTTVDVEPVEVPDAPRDTLRIPAAEPSPPGDTLRIPARDDGPPADTPEPAREGPPVLGDPAPPPPRG
ncbi:PBP1A family penicillin-binding protein [Longimicrobium sp.]|uniref:PBP1A family penicillin-binding protein n=1 Tax=Longimicrobium sp. TaxID=2029185 RepID=UPI002E33AB15|nr:PBP1A family penicillin-binding protein [Longimicrobium sp.]HEX6040022.1 PBP1A family penicillin-binding protein [Longimicrobium sp.]